MGLYSSNDSGKFEVYKCIYNGEVVYIGHGKIGRHKHCKSGRSHSKDLNKIVEVEGKDVLQVKIVSYHKYKYNATAKEQALIKRFKPKFNIAYHNSFFQESDNSKYVSSRDLNSIIVNKEIDNLLVNEREARIRFSRVFKMLRSLDFSFEYLKYVFKNVFTSRDADKIENDELFVYYSICFLNFTVEDYEKFKQSYAKEFEFLLGQMTTPQKSEFEMAYFRMLNRKDANISGYKNLNS